MHEEIIAKVAHEVNRAYCRAFGDHSQPDWEDAPQWQKTSTIDGVKFHLENPDADPRSSHKAWMAQKIIEGWQWGPEKDPERKLHPCLMPFEELPVTQRVKDFLFSAIVRELSKL